MSSAADLRLSPSITRDLIEEHMNARVAYDGVTQAERQQWGDREQRKYESIIGLDFASRAEAASQVLKQVSGRTVDVANLARTNGAIVATNILLRAERLAARAVSGRIESGFPLEMERRSLGE